MANIIEPGQIISIAFGPYGSSWFAIHAITRSGRLQGQRWNTQGFWGPLKVIHPREATDKRTPQCLKPAFPESAHG